MILHGDCIEQMRTLDDASVDAVVTDPPYGLEFMGKEWDALGKSGVQRKAEVGGGDKRAIVDPDEWGGGESSPYSRSRVRWQHGAAGPRAMQEWHEAWATEALRVLKPGGHLLAFGGTRTYHRLACAIEDAGFEIRDCLAWMYGSGFPKSLDVSKAIDKAAGAEREVVGPGQYAGRESEADLGVMNDDAWEGGAPRIETAPATPEAAQWQGWGTALKPAHEPIVLARKPLTGTVAQNCLAHGTGALNVDGTRVGMSDEDREAARVPQPQDGTGEIYGFAHGTGRNGETFEPAEGGRWPANVILDPEAAALLDEQSGERTSGKLEPHHADNGKAAGTLGAFAGAPGRESYGDTGGASRFFYTAKASRAERNAGLEGFEERAKHVRVQQSAGRQLAGKAESFPVANVHPTVKPIALMRWLCRLVTPPGGTVLDPFCGSGTTGCAAALEGFDFIGCEREDEYIAIAEARIAFWSQYEGAEVEAVLQSEDRELRDQGQLDLLGEAA